MTSRRHFDLYLGIDWSGAKGTRHKGIQVAEADPGDTPPRLLRPTDGKVWSRLAVLDLIAGLIEDGRRILVGMDFATAYEWCGHRAYFPGTDVEEPTDAPALWDLVDRLAEDTPDRSTGGRPCPAQDLYGAAIYQRRDVDYHHHFLSPLARGDLYRHRQRACEIACAGVTAPHPVLKCIGAANVGTGSLAGMRFLLHLKRRVGDAVALWPFDAQDRDRSVIVESFPRRYFMVVGADPRAWGDPANIAALLHAHGSRSMPGPGGTPFTPASEDEADAIAIAAALRPLSLRETVWRPPSMTEDARLHEGWIFGVE